MQSLLNTLFGILASLAAMGPASAAPPGDASNDYRLNERIQTPPAPATQESAYKQTDWEALMPRDWDPMKVFEGLDLEKLRDSDPQAIGAIRRLREMWESAPAEPAMNGASIRIPGFVVPLEGEREEVTEFLLVPNFGGCIHVPPPPANQIIHVFAAKPEKLQAMHIVWVSGVLETVRSRTDMGNAGYRMKAARIAPYEEVRN